MTGLNQRVLAIVLGCAVSACASRGPIPVTLPQTEPGAPSEAHSQFDVARPQDEVARAEEREHKSYALPIVEILAMDAAFSIAGRAIY